MMCRGQAYDNAFTMAGIRSGVQCRIKQVNSKAVFIPCANHLLNLAGVHAVATSEHSATFFGRRRLKGIHSRPDTNRTGAEGLSFYYPRLLHFLDQMLAVMPLSQHRVSSSKTVRPRAPCGARCIGHAVRTWSAVCSEAPHSRFGERGDPICAWTNGIAQHQSPLCAMCAESLEHFLVLWKGSTPFFLLLLKDGKCYLSMYQLW